MRLALAVNRNNTYQPAPEAPDDEFEEFDSPETVNAIAETIASFGHEVKILEADRTFPQALQAGHFDFVFNIAEGLHGRAREAQVPAVCDMLGIPFSGSDAVTMGLTLDKELARRVVAGSHVPIARGRLFRHVDQIDLHGLRFPIIVKPNAEGSSKGIGNNSRIDSESNARVRIVELIEKYRGPVLVEEFLAGPECTVGVLGNQNPRVIGIMEIAPRNQKRVQEFVYSLEVKRDYINQVEYHVPPRFSKEIIARIEKIALAAYDALGCRDFARIDIRLDADNGSPFFIEANPLPGLSPIKGDLVILAKGMGMEYRELIGRILDLAFIRSGLNHQRYFSDEYS